MVETLIGSGTTLRAMAVGVGGEIGTTFLERVVLALREAMDAELVLITLGEGKPATHAQAVFALKSGVPKNDIAYSLDGTPCELVYEGQTLVVPDGLEKRFPREVGRAGYVGVPIRNASNAVIGNFAVFSKVPIAAPDMARDIVRIFAARVEAEMQHRVLISERDALIADLKSVNESVTIRNQALHDANEFKTGVLGMVAHDLRNPLSVIVAKVELLQARLRKPEIDEDKIQGDLEKVMKSADRLTDIIEATLTRCRSDSAEVELHLRRTEVTSLVRQAVANNAGDARRKQIDLEISAEGQLHAVLDESLCLEAIDNLISNAVKYSPIGKRVWIEVRANDGMVEVRVQDQGLGMTEDDLKQAFSPFKTLSAKPTAGEKATGLGLCNVSQIAVAHGGEIKAESDGKGKGTLFTLRLPAEGAGLLDDVMGLATA